MLFRFSPGNDADSACVCISFQCKFIFYNMEAQTTQSAEQPVQAFDVYKWLAWLDANRKPLIIGAAVAVVIGSVIGFTSWKRNQDEARANELLFSLPPAFGGGDKIGRPSVQELQRIANEYPSTSAGQQAELLAAQALFDSGDFEKSRNAFLKFQATHEDSPFVAQAAVGVAASLEGLGSTDEAIRKYQDVIARYSGSGVVDPIKLTLARLLEEKQQWAQALKYYQELSRVASRFDPWASEAQEREMALLAKHPELKQAAKPAAAAATPALPAAKTTVPQVVQPAASAAK
jgi:predicted negative regulator of RcsB-dependent stress response